MGHATRPTSDSDGKGAAYMCWQDYRNGHPDIFAQHLDNLGKARWQVNGLPVCTADGPQTYAFIISDSAGDAIIVLEDGRPGSDIHMYGQRIQP